MAIYADPSVIHVNAVEGHWDVSITGFSIEELDSVQFYHDIIFCLESDSFVVPFSLSTGFLRVDFRQFWL